MQGTQPSNHEKIVYMEDAKVGLKGIIAIHSTVLGPAVGGARVWNYESEAALLQDALRLSEGMSYKCSLAGLDWGGGKTAIWVDPSKVQKKDILNRYADFVNSLEGRYVTAKDVGIQAEDLRIIRDATAFVLGAPQDEGTSGDPSPMTAYGVFCGMQTALEACFGDASFRGRKVLVQGLGAVGLALSQMLLEANAEVWGGDINPSSQEKAKQLGVKVVEADKHFYTIPCDIFSPNALGGVLNPYTLSLLNTKIIAGGANNQLSSSFVGDALHAKGIYYAPDYAINAGGVINVCSEGLVKKHYDQQKALQYIKQHIPYVLQKIFQLSKERNLPSYQVADALAKERIEKALHGSVDKTQLSL